MVFVPLRDFVGKVFAVVFCCWTTSKFRVFRDDVEGNYLVAFGDAIMAEVSRLHTVSGPANPTYRAPYSPLHRVHTPITSIILSFCNKSWQPRCLKGNSSPLFRTNSARLYTVHLRRPNFYWKQTLTTSRGAYWAPCTPAAAHCLTPSITS